MSQTTRSKVRALERHRRAVARELASVRAVRETVRPVKRYTPQPGQRVLDLVALQLRDGGTFDVHAAREHARQLIAKGLDLTTGPEHEVWTDWRAWWAGKSKTPDECPATASGHGGQYARLGQRILDMLEGQPDACVTCFGTAIGKTETHGPFEGQGGEVSFTLLEHPCEPCHGTGHNLRGKLPGVEWSPAVRRKTLDSMEEFDDANPAHRRGHLYRIERSLPLEGRMLAHSPPDHAEHGYRYTSMTRVCPRGEHRNLDPGDLIANGEATDSPVSLRYNWQAWRGDEPELDDYVEYGSGGGPPEHNYAAHGDALEGFKHETAMLPAWRSGELEHARQRRERDALREARILEHARSVGAPADAFRRLAAAVQGVA